MTGDDPFGLENDTGRTRVRPRAGGADRSAARPQPVRAGQPDLAPVAPVRDLRASDNPLVRAFSGLLGLAPELERAVAPESPEVLRTRMQDTLIRARDAAVAQGVPLSRADQGAWFVGALIDDIAINTPWGGSSGWPRNPLVAALYGNVDAGERFYDLAAELLRYPDRDREMLELVFLCLSLGFRGRYRIDGGAGEAAIAQLRGQMARELNRRDAEPPPLAPNWQGVKADDEKRGFTVPLWSIGLIAVALLAAIYVGLGIRLSNRGEQLFTLASVLPPPERADIFRPIVETVAEPEPLAEPVFMEFLPLFAEAAPPETVSALTGREDVSVAVVVVQATAPEVFRSAKAVMNDAYVPLIETLAAVIRDNADLIGGVKVVGHTDSIPVQRSNPFRSNQGLSEARAKAIADMLVTLGVPPALVTFEGRAATEPIADNGTRAGRARNRRVEIILQKKV